MSGCDSKMIRFERQLIALSTYFVASFLPSSAILNRKGIRVEPSGALHLRRGSQVFALQDERRWERGNQFQRIQTKSRSLFNLVLNYLVNIAFALWWRE